jgi:uncharacterized membrane-anchored protein YhcB (DUF1043 family)
MSLTDYEIIGLAIGMVGIYVKLHSEVMTIKAQQYSLENNNEKVDKKLEQVVDDLAEIKLLLARNQMDK